MRNRRIASAAALATIVALAGCSDSGADSTKDETEPTPSATATTPLPAGLKTPPAAPELTGEERSAADLAAAAYLDGSRAIFTLEADPSSAVADKSGTAAIIETYYTAPYADVIRDTIKLFNDQGRRVEGQETVRWAVPRKVDLSASVPQVVLQQCITFEDFRITEGKTKITVPETSLARVTMKADGGGKAVRSWRISNVESDGAC